MSNASNNQNDFDVINCRAHAHIEGLVDCLSPNSACFCGYALYFGKGCFCTHPCRKAIIENTKKLQSMLSPPPQTSQSEDQ